MTFWVVGMINFGLTFLPMWLVGQVAIGMGLFLSALCENMISASAFAPTLSLPAVLFGGLFANSSTMPVWLKWLEYISPIYYSNQAIGRAQWENREGNYE